jgi:hypothetical protein
MRHVSRMGAILRANYAEKGNIKGARSGKRRWFVPLVTAGYPISSNKKAHKLWDGL